MGFGGLEITQTGITQIKTALPPSWRSVTLIGIGLQKMEYSNKR
jgi:hypothetical protein